MLQQVGYVRVYKSKKKKTEEWRTEDGLDREAESGIEAAAEVWYEPLRGTSQSAAIFST